MSYRSFAATFRLIKEGKQIDVESGDYLWLEFREGNYVHHDLDAGEIKRQIECDEKVEALPDGEYDCLIAGTYNWDISYDSEGNKDAELIADITTFEIQDSIKETEQ